MFDFQYVQFDWDENGQLLFCVFGDVYFFWYFGFNEMCYVFFVINCLVECFVVLGDGEVLCIGEIGFGIGLNFFCVWQLFEWVVLVGVCLEFVSVEKFFFVVVDLCCVLVLWLELVFWSEVLLGQYFVVYLGFQCLVFVGGRVGLILLLGDVLECLLQFDVWVDVWFFDGFVLVKNLDMWLFVLFVELV